jgi:superfamily II DNA or RNA helicase
MITDYHAKYYAFELTKRCSSDNIEKLTPSLVDAQVDLNPHQVDAALFAFRSPLSKGAILADEVGLGKTIEAGIILSQKWAERKRKILIILPANLRKQWSQELYDKFFIPSLILETKSFNQLRKEGIENPFESDEIVLCSYQFARNKASFMRKIPWDLVVIDEAHRLRNVYKTSNKIAKEIRNALQGVPKLLLTATPLQNSLMELYGLISFVDDYKFGDDRSFRNQFSRITSKDDLLLLKERIAPVCKRTLRRQVLEYVSFTRRIPITQEFYPTPDEQDLYDMVSAYLQRLNLQALPASQRKLMTLVMRKLLASSTFAIAGTLESLENKLKDRLKKEEKNIKRVAEELGEDFESLEDIWDEWGEEELEILSPEDIETIRKEIDDLKTFKELAISITENAKGIALLTALEKGFEKAESLGAKKKAIIFTESKRTQNYLLRILSEAGYGDKIVIFNGSNSDAQAVRIYKNWFEKYKGTSRVSGSKTADTRAALVDYFKDEAQIMIATEAAAEGVNLQFCSLVVNYDLPWNPQRIEQRIGRCHRYGQKYDVVVINFLNRKNEADQRVHQLLSEKFALFEGVFGASDEVLGTIGSGVDFEKRILSIYQDCRTNEEIQASFDALQEEMEEQIDEALRATRNKLLENFDEEVAEKLKISRQKSQEFLNKYELWLWNLTKHYLKPHACFDSEKCAFNLSESLFKDIPSGLYRIGKNIEDAYVYRIGHPLAQRILNDIQGKNLTDAEVTFDYTDYTGKISILKPLLGKTGYLTVSALSITAFEDEDYLIFSMVDEEGNPIDEDEARRLFSLPGKVTGENSSIKFTDKMQEIFYSKKQEIIGYVSERNSALFDEEIDKLEKWAEDVKKGIEMEIASLDREIKMKKTEARKLLKLEDKIEAQKVIKDMEKHLKNSRQDLFKVQDEVEAKKEELIEEIQNKLEQIIIENKLFSIRWKLV